MIEKNCLYCKIIFNAKHGRCGFCSEECRKTNASEYKKKWNKKNDNYAKSKRAKWYDEHKETTIKRAQEWRKNNPELCKEYAKKKRLNELHEAKIRQRHKNVLRDYCRRCGSKKNLNLHHIDYSGDIDKTIVLCNKCHFEEHKREWRKELKFGELK